MLVRFTSTSISLGRCVLTPNRFIDPNSEIQIDDFLRIMTTVCVNLENYANQLYARGYDNRMIEDMVNLANVSNILGMKWTGIKNGKDSIKLDFKFVREDDHFE